MILRFIKTLPSALLLSVALVAMIPSHTAWADANTTPIAPAYNTDIIDDAVFLNATTMSVQDIQNFLNAKVPVCDTNHQGGLAQYPPPYVCLKDYIDPTTGKQASQLIYDEARSRGINPQVILVTLQKEQGLITDTWPYPSQYKSAMGYGCPESQTVCDSAYYGFYNQVHLGSGLLRADEARSCGDTTTLPGFSDIPTELKLGHTTNPTNDGGANRVDGVATTIGSCSTGSLYNYTPHRPDSAYTSRNGVYYYGNYNFIHYFTSWFGSTYGSPLYKTPTGSQIYAVANGTKYLIPDMDTFKAYGFDKLKVNDVDQATIDAFAIDADNATLTTVGHVGGDPNGTTYLFDAGKRYTLDGTACAKNLDGSQNSATTWGIDCFNTAVNKTLPAQLVLNYSVLDGPIPPMMANGNTAYKLQGGLKRPILDQAFIDVLGGWSKVRWMENVNASQPLGRLLSLNGVILNFSDSGKVYLYDSDTLIPIPNIDTYLAWGFDKMKARLLPATYNQGNAALPSAPDLSVFAANANGLISLVDSGRKLPLGSQAQQWPIGTPTTLAVTTLANLPTVTLPSVFSASGGSIFTVYGGKKFVFPTFDDFFGLGFSLNQVGQVSLYTERLFDGAFGGYHLASGRLYKVSGSDVIRIINNANSYAIPSPSYFGYLALPTDKIISVDTTTASRYPDLGSVPLAYKATSGVSYIASGVRRQITAGMAVNYGINSVSLPTLSDSINNRLPVGQDLSQFAKISNGQIFYISGGQRRYITTPQKLVSLGGNSGNIENLPDEFVLTLPDGGSI